MKSENLNLLETIGKIDDNLIYNAVKDTPKKKRPSWLKWGAVAACLCLMVCAYVASHLATQSNPTGTSTTGTDADVGQTQFLHEAEELYVEIVEWKINGFKAVVVDTGNNSIFPLEGELSVEFDYDTKIILTDGTTYEFNPDEPDTESIGWEIGTIVKVEFTEYNEYLEGNHFYNYLLASSIKVVTSE